MAIASLVAGNKEKSMADAKSAELALKKLVAESIRIVHRGQRVYDPELVLQGMDAESPLTGKERKALGLAHQGMSSKQIAEQLFISEGTVRNYLSEAMHKLGAKNRVEAGRTAHLKGWL